MPASALISLSFLAVLPLAFRYDERATWLMLPALLLVFAALEAALGRDLAPPASARVSRLARLPVWLYIGAQLAAIAWGMAAVSDSASVSAMGRLGLAVATGLTGGIFGMLAAHEMIHSRSRAERVLGLGMLTGVSYLHFSISHVYGHHRRAATAEDPATARRDESAYRFVLRSITGQWEEAWRFERERTRRRGRSWLANRVYRYAAVTLALYVAIGVAFGGRAIAFELTQSAVAILVLELFNYVAHYGLERRLQPDGRRAPLGPEHCWNATQRFDAWALLNGGFHSRHHRRPAAAYSTLCHEHGAPELPTGLAGSILIALVPPLWRRLMNPRVDVAMSA